MTLKSLTLDDLERDYGEPIVRYCGYTVSRNNHYDMCRARQSPKLIGCSLIFFALMEQYTSL